MADNVTLNAGTGGDTVAADDIAGVKHQRVKVEFGVDGAATDVSSSDPLPVVQTGALPAGTNAIGKLAANSGVDIGDVDVASIAAGDNNIGNVDIVTMPNVTLAAGTNTNEVVGDGAHDAAVAGNPLRTSGYASAAAPTDVGADGRTVNDWNLRNGAKCVQVTAAGALIAGDATNGLDVDVTRLPALVAGTANIGDVDVLTLPAIPTGDNTIGRVKHTDGTLVQGLVDETGASAVDAAAIGGGTPHDAVNSGNPLYLGAEAIAHGSNPAAVAAADRTKLYANRHGVLFFMGGHPNSKTTTVRRADADGSVTDGQIGPAIGAGLKIAVTRVSITCSKANTVNVAVKVGFGTANVPADSTSDGAGILVDHDGIAPGSGVVIGNGSGILGIGADNEELRWTADDPVGGSVIISVTYFTIES